MILDLDPENDSCRGYLQNSRQRCSKPTNPSKRWNATKLLNEMNHKETLSPDDLRKLAEFLLCLEVHNSSRAHLSQVNAVCNEWQEIFFSYQETVSSHQERKNEKSEEIEELSQKVALIDAKVEDLKAQQLIANEVAVKFAVCSNLCSPLDNANFTSLNQITTYRPTTLTRPVFPKAPLHTSQRWTPLMEIMETKTPKHPLLWKRVCIAVVTCQTKRRYIIRAQQRKR